MIAALNLDIDDREKTIREQEREINRLMEGADNRQTGAGDAGLETPRKQRARKKAGPHIRQRSQLPSELIVMLGDAEDDVEQEVEDEFDEKEKADVDEDEKWTEGETGGGCGGKPWDGDGLHYCVR